MTQQTTVPPRDVSSGDLDVLVVGMEWFLDEPGGLNRYLRDLVAALPGPSGVRVAAVVLASDVAPASGVIGVEALHRSLPARLWSFRSTLSRVTTGDVPDVVNIHFALYGWLTSTLPRLRKIPTIVNFQGPWAQEDVVERQGSRLMTCARRALERFVYVGADECIVLSNHFRDLLIADYRVLPSRIHVVRPGVDLVRFGVLSREEARSRLDIPRDGQVVVTVRRLAARMGLDVLLNAWAQLDQGLLVIAGVGPEAEALLALVDRLGLGPDRVRFIGAVDDADLPHLYAAADATVVPSLQLEGFGLVVLESLAAGTPVIASDTGGMAEVLPDLQSNLLVPPGDASALASRLRRALRTPESLPSTQACRSFAEGFSWTRRSLEVRDVFELARRRPPARPLRVVYLVHSGALGGGELSLLRLLRALPEVAPHVILGDGGPLADLLSDEGIDHEVLPISARLRGARRDRPETGVALDLATYTVRLARRLRQLRPDVVHTNTLKAALYGPPAARLAGIPVVVHCRDRIESDYLPSAVVRPVRAALRVLPDAAIANSRATAASLRLPSHRAPAVIPSPVSPPPHVRPVRDEVRTVALLGRLSPWKGQHLALRAFVQAFPVGDVRLRVIGAALFGEDAYADSLHELAVGLGIDDRVDFVGHRSDVYEQLAQVDLLVHSSTIPEPLGNVVLEGMAAGVPVIASDAGGPAEILTNNRDGLLTPLGDVPALAQAMRHLATSAEVRRRLVASAQETVKAYAPERVAADVMGVYRRVLTLDRV